MVSVSSVINLPQFSDAGGYFAEPETPLKLSDSNSPTECIPRAKGRFSRVIASHQEAQSPAFLFRLVVILWHHRNNLLQSGEQGAVERLFWGSRRPCTCLQLSIMGCCSERRALKQQLVSRLGG